MDCSIARESLSETTGDYRTGHCRTGDCSEDPSDASKDSLPPLSASDASPPVNWPCVSHGYPSGDRRRDTSGVHTSAYMQHWQGMDKVRIVRHTHIH